MDLKADAAYIDESLIAKVQKANKSEMFTKARVAIFDERLREIDLVSNCILASVFVGPFSAPGVLRVSWWRCRNRKIKNESWVICGRKSETC
jgi:hypothetical protein